jgi:GR25 family glycosyltransferase involved in LPS biosynthesis
MVLFMVMAAFSGCVNFAHLKFKKEVKQMKTIIFFIATIPSDKKRYENAIAQKTHLNKLGYRCEIVESIKCEDLLIEHFDHNGNIQCINWNYDSPKHAELCEILGDGNMKEYAPRHRGMYFSLDSVACSVVHSLCLAKYLKHFIEYKNFANLEDDCTIEFIEQQILDIESFLNQQTKNNTPTIVLGNYCNRAMVVDVNNNVINIGSINLLRPNNIIDIKSTTLYFGNQSGAQEMLKVISSFHYPADSWFIYQVFSNLKIYLTSHLLGGEKNFLSYIGLRRDSGFTQYLLELFRVYCKSLVEYILLIRRGKNYSGSNHAKIKAFVVRGVKNNEKKGE